MAVHLQTDQTTKESMVTEAGEVEAQYERATHSETVKGHAAGAETGTLIPRDINS
jgi:hypothetical protein